ncbi:MAG: signal peptidase II [Bacteroidetes bacterium]|nr:signal peptidase II [Bacteroidota bacterium]MCB0851646.1 signal peptidase II [Bacteroidota bacterium]
MKQARKYFLIALGIIALDQIVKIIVKLNMVMGQAGQIKILGNFFKLYFIENNGAAFGFTISNMIRGMGGDMSEETGKLILSVFSIIAVIAIGYVLFKLATHKSPLPYFVAMIFGGALGNIIDRTFYGVFFASQNDYSGGLFHGRVVDMFYIDLWRGVLPEWIPVWGGEYTALWPIFNIADAAISIGIVVVLVFQGKFFKMDEDARKPAATNLDKASSVDSQVTETNFSATLENVNQIEEETKETPLAKPSDE